MEEYSDRDQYGDNYEEMEPYTVKSAGLKYGLYLGVVSIVLSVLQFMAMGGSGSYILMGASVLIAVIAIVFAHNEFKRNNEGFMSYGEGLGIGVLVSIISGTISGAFGILYRTVIDPNFNQKVLESTRRTLEDAGTYNEAQIEQVLEMSQKFSTPGVSLLIALLSSAIVGLLMSLIISAITKNTRPMFD
ncbi:DUF4199 domain-containing protein [Microscilla marina]|uniref:DUF4199 domain-containing protein n=1 Tax=Microscilla marina ATCC 23134 TaxID=313606 RepID=A1ZY17_MICM2|nr:DUF4199 domain-containing protein [Microscilla marina]EAY24754.1 hypothetical protein M23134_05556 [Microscilla marina ATCC 23134]